MKIEPQKNVMTDFTQYNSITRQTLHTVLSKARIMSNAIFARSINNTSMVAMRP